MATIAADLVLILHGTWVAFIVGMIPAIHLGKTFNWKWIRGFGIRVTHLVLMGYVLVETYFAIPCPLTLLENSLRPAKAGYSENGCVMDWFYSVTGQQLPTSAFEAFYVFLFLYIAWLYFKVPPRRERSAQYV